MDVVHGWKQILASVLGRQCRISSLIPFPPWILLLLLVRLASNYLSQDSSAGADRHLGPVYMSDFVLG